MAYSDFTLTDLDHKFGIKHTYKSIDFSAKSIEPSQRLKDDLQEASLMPLKSEKAKSEWIVVPILRELLRNNPHRFSLFSGENLNVDKKRGLFGECDYLFSAKIDIYEVDSPIFQIVEAKKNDIELGINQCAAQLVGAKTYNLLKNQESSVLYGCSTTGNDWNFLLLNEEGLIIDQKKYYLSEINLLLGVFQTIIEKIKN